MGVHQIGQGIVQNKVQLGKDALDFDRVPNSWIIETEEGTEGPPIEGDIPGGSLIETTDPLTESGAVE
jgi:hypothetical protein